jgi:hypothetical protein
MRGWLTLAAGLGLFAAGYWLMWPLLPATMTIFVPDPSALHGGLAVWKTPVATATEVRAGFGVASVLAAGLVMLWAWRSGDDPIELLGEGSRRALGFLVFIPVLWGAMVGLAIVSNELRWTHQQADMVMYGAAGAWLLGLAVYAGAGLLLALGFTAGALTDKGPRPPGFGFVVAWIMLLFGGIVAFALITGLGLVLPLLPFGGEPRRMIALAFALLNSRAGKLVVFAWLALTAALAWLGRRAERRSEREL